MKTKRKKWNARELFLMVNELLRAEHVYPEDLLEYSSAGSGSEMILSEQFDIIPRVVHGQNEGIYMDILLVTNDNARVFSNHKPSIRLGTFKTLRTDKEAYVRMSTLGAEFVYALSEYVNNNMDEFNWVGFDLSIFRNDGVSCGEMTVYKRERAIERAQQFLAEMGAGAYAMIRDNMTGKTMRIA